MSIKNFFRKPTEENITFDLERSLSNYSSQQLLLDKAVDLINNMELLIDHERNCAKIKAISVGRNSKNVKCICKLRRIKYNLETLRLELRRHETKYGPVV